VDVARVVNKPTDDRRPLITLSVQLCVQRDGRLNVAELVARVGRRQLRLVCSDEALEFLTRGNYRRKISRYQGVEIAADQPNLIYVCMKEFIMLQTLTA